MDTSLASLTAYIGGHSVQSPWTLHIKNGQVHSPRSRNCVYLAVEVATLQLEVKEYDLENLLPNTHQKLAMVFREYYLEDVYRSVLFKLSEISISVLSSVVTTCYLWLFKLN